MGGEIDNEIIKNFALNPFQIQFDQNFAFMYLQIEREHIIEQTLNSLLSENLNLRKPLKIKFVGELGVDEGGVQKEFFQILVRDLFDPGYTMFTDHQDSRLLWFNGSTLESNYKFELVGVLMGIAIYNSNILDLHLPMACYKKLLND